MNNWHHLDRVEGTQEAYALAAHVHTECRLNACKCSYESCLINFTSHHKIR